MVEVCNISVSSWGGVSAIFLSTPALVTAAENSWTKPNSGDWEEQAYWSLGVRPDATQSVLFTNAGWKALAIGANTAQNFPQSMRVQSLRVDAPVDSFNTLLINWAGFEIPLQTTSLTIGSNSSVAIHGSVLEVIGNSNDWSTGNLLVRGTFIQSDLSLVKTRTLSINSDSGIGPGVYFLTNGILSASGIGIGGSSAGRFFQYGGSNNAGSIGLFLEAQYDLYGGRVTATNGLSVGSDLYGYANFFQHGGSVSADTVINGGYVLNGGSLTGRMLVPSETARANGNVLQTGGTNVAVSLDLGLHADRFGGMGTYVLSNGIVRSQSSARLGASRFWQYDGQHTIVSNLIMKGFDVGPGIADAQYFLSGGTLSAAGLTAEAALFEQDGGTNAIAGDVVLTGPSFQTTRNPPGVRYLLSAGRFSARNVLIDTFFGGFHQTGGTSQITEKLTVQGSNSTSLGYCCYFGYALEGGTLAVKDIYVGTGAFFQHTGGSINHSGVLTLNEGDWHAAAGDHALGPLQLGIGQSNRISFTSGSSALRLADSRAQPWASSAILYITNWHGSASGGGATRLYFGSSANGLTPQQLAQIRFNISDNLYPARILATGEVVPQMQMLTSSHAGNALTLRWEPGWTLQSSTNIAGPYQDVQGAASPYTPSMEGPRRFFRLRQ